MTETIEKTFPRGENMSATGLGASVKRKEDIRFITGKGHYVDDVNRHGQAYAYFLRSPHAHATIDKIELSDALNSKGVVAIYTGDDIAADKVGGLICGWMIHSKDGAPMKAGAHPALAQGKVRYVGDHVAVVIADTYADARDAAEKIDVSYGVLPPVVDPAKAADAGQPEVHDAAPNNTVFNWRLGDEAATDAAFASAAHVTKLDLVNNRLIPNAMEPRAAVGDYNSGSDTITLYTTSQNPHVARLVLSAFIGLAPEHKLRVIAPDVGGGFGSKIFIYAEETVCAWAAKKIDRPVKWTADRTEAFLSDAHGRDHVTHAEMALDASGKITGVRVHTIANMGAYLVDLRLVGADLSLRAVTVRAIQHPGDLRRGGRGLHDDGAGRRLPRRRPSGGDLRRRTAGGNGGAAARARPGRVPPAELHYPVPPPDAGHHGL